MQPSSNCHYVLQICHSYYDPFLDCARQYAALFHGKPYKVVTVFLSGEKSDEVANKAGADEVIFLEYSSKQLTGLKLKIISDIRKISKQYPFDFCIAHRIKPTYVALMATKLPVLSIQHTFGCFDRLSRQLLVNLFKQRVNIIAVSNALRDEIRNRFNKWPQNRITTLYNHIDISKVTNEQVSQLEARNKLQIPENAWIIGNVGRLHPDKDQATLIRAFAKAKPNLPENSYLVIVGKGRLEDELKQLSRALAVDTHIIFTGPVPNASAYFKAFDIFVLSSDSEPFGMVLLEAMAANIPIICSDCGGGGEITQPIGHLFPFQNEDVLSELITVQALSHEDVNHTPYLTQNFSDEAVSRIFWETSYPALTKSY